MDGSPAGYFNERQGSRDPRALAWGWGVFSSFQVEPEFTSLLLSGQPSPSQPPGLPILHCCLGSGTTAQQPSYSMELGLGDNSLDT